MPVRLSQILRGRPMSKSLCRLVIFLILFRLAPPAGSAQAGKAELLGEVRDATGAIIAAALVTVTEAGTNQIYVSKTSPSGVYMFTALKPGLYTLRVKAQGFKSVERQGIQLPIGERVRIDAELVVGGIRESITVQADAPVLRTDSARLGQVISSQAVLDLPLKSRDFIALMALSPGVALPPGSSFPRINGGRPRVNEYLYDGVSVLQPEPGQVAFFPIVDAVQEFKVETNNPSAEFGRFSGGVINLSTKSGTNRLHGSIFEFFRNEVLNARNLFASRTDREKPRFHRNQFGFVLGGPIRRDKTFFFGDYQGTRQRIGRIQISTVPTLLQRQGIFTEPVGDRVPQIFDPATTRLLPEGGFTRDRFANNTIPAEQIDSIARTLLQHYPLPNLPGAANNFRRVGTEAQDQDQFDVRLDHRFGEQTRLFGRYSLAQDDTIPVTPLPDGSGNLTSGVLGPTKTRGQSFLLNALHTWGSQLATEIRFGYTRRSVQRQALLLEQPPSHSLGLVGIPTNGAFNNELPTFLISGFQQIGPPPNTGSDFRTDVTQLVAIGSYQRGRHGVKAGLDLRWTRLDILQPPSPTGQFRFTSLFTDLSGTAGTGFPLASFLLGQVQDFSIDLQQKKLRPRAHFAEFFVQDDWKATSQLALNLGLRSTLNFPSTEMDNQGAVFNLETQQLEYRGRDRFARSARELHKLNFGPRVGLAYRFGRWTVLRSGYGVIWIDQAGITTPFTNPQFPYIQTATQRTLDNISPAFMLSNGPNVQPIPFTPDAGLGQGVFSVDRDLGSGYAQHWNLAIQRELSDNLSFEIAYAGSKGTHIGIPDTNLNQLTVEQLRMGTALLQPVPNPFFGQVPPSSSLGGPTIARAQLLKPFPRFTTVSLYRNNVGNTNYHALQAKLEKRFSHRLAFLASYTRSKLIDDASSVFDASILTGPVANFPVADSFNRRLDRDVSTGDIPHVFVGSWSYELPFGLGQGGKQSGIAEKFMQGWQVAGAITLQSGLPVAIVQATNFNSFGGFGTQRPNCIANRELPASQRSTAQFFNTAAFQVVPQFTLGTCSRNPVRGASYRNVDIAIIKRTEISEKISLDFRAEIYNLTNTPPLGNPNALLGAADFGSITSAGDPRVIQLALKLNF